MDAERDMLYDAAGAAFLPSGEEDRKAHDSRFKRARKLVNGGLLLCFALSAPIMVMDIVAISDQRQAQIVHSDWFPWVSLGYFLLVAVAGVTGTILGVRSFARYGPPSSFEVARRLQNRHQTATANRALAEAAAGLESKVIPLRQKAPVALMVVHGIGVQERNETLDAAVDGLTIALKGDDWGYERVGDCMLDKVPPGCTEEDLYGKRLMTNSGKVLDAYELYWAPLVEGIMTWKEVLLWSGTLITRIPRRLQLAIKGSHTLPHPDSLEPAGENETDRQNGLRLQKWVRQTQQDIKTKARYGLSYLLIVLVVLGVVGIGLVKAWQVGLGLSAPLADDDKAVHSQIEELSANTCIERRLAGNGCQFSDLWTTVPEGNRQAVHDQLNARLIGDDKPLTALCQGECRFFTKLYLAALIGRGYSPMDYFNVSVGTVLDYPVMGFLVILLTALLAHGAIHAGKAWTRRKAHPKFKRLSDVNPEHDQSRFHRDGMRSASLALVSLSAYVVLMSAWVLLTLNMSFENPELTEDVTAIELVTLCTGIAYMAIYQGILPFLARYVADVPIQANRSSYGRGFEARKNVQEKSVQLLGQLLREYDSVVVIAHSQGTVVTYEMFHAYQRRVDRQEREPVENPLPPLTGVKSYVTIGVALSKVQDLVQGFDDPGATQWAMNYRLFNTEGIEGVSKFYPCEGHIRWFNYWMMSDIVCNPLRDYLPVHERLIPWHTVSLHALWTHSDYWNAVSFYKLLVEHEVSALRLAYQRTIGTRAS